MNAAKKVMLMVLVLGSMNVYGQVRNAKGDELDIVCVLEGKAVYRPETSMAKRPYNEIYKGDTIFGSHEENPRFYLHQSDEFKATLAPAEQHNVDPKMFGADAFVDISGLTESEVNKVYDILLKQCSYIVTDEQKFSIELESGWGAGKHAVWGGLDDFDWKYDTSKPYMVNRTKYIQEADAYHEALRKKYQDQN